MERNPLVTVVIPVFNAAPYLAESLHSVLDQDFEPVEIIAVDNGSTDGSVAVLDRYRDRVTVLHEAARGAGAARNAGLRASRGEFIAFQDADDVWLPGKLRAQVDYLTNHPDVGIVFGQFANWWPDSQGRFPPPASFLSRRDLWLVNQPLTGWIYADELLSCPIAMITPVIRREVVRTVGVFDETLEAGEDYDFWLRATYCFKAHKLPQCVALYRHHPTATTAKVRALNTTALVLQSAIRRTGVIGPDGRGVTPRQLDEHFAELWLTFALLHLEKGNVGTGLGALHRYFSHDPQRKRAWQTALKATPWALRNRFLARLRRNSARAVAGPAE